MARWSVCLALGAFACAHSEPRSLDLPDDGALLPVAAFDAIPQQRARSVALFGEMARVFQHPRCANCHPSDDQPRQTDAQVVHDPPVWRGPDNHGEPGAHCSTCHQADNSEVSRVPGAESWHLAPASMAWLGRSPAQLCAQLKDPARNGDRDLEALHEHLANDPLVAWGWEPGHGRQPAPGSQAELAALTRAWIETGAHCPEETP